VQLVNFTTEVPEPVDAPGLFDAVSKGIARIMMRDPAYEVDADVRGRESNPRSQLAPDNRDQCVGTATFVLTRINQPNRLSHIVVTGRHCLLMEGETVYYVDYFYLLLEMAHAAASSMSVLSRPLTWPFCGATKRVQGLCSLPPRPWPFHARSG
jgi:hypothetical protein